MMIAGRAATIFCASAAASNTSTITGSAPSARRSSAFSRTRVVPVTRWPAATRSGTRRRPMAPDAPARKMRSPMRLRRQHLQHMPRGIAEVESAPALPAVDLAVLERKGAAAIGDAFLLDAGEDRVELGLADLERVVMALEAFLDGEVERERVVDAHFSEMPATALIAKAEDAREEPRTLLLVTRGNDGVVENDTHARVLLFLLDRAPCLFRKGMSAGEE